MLIMCENANVIIDIPARKAVARYASNYMRGCIVGNKFWICQEGKILWKPFPAFEEVPPVKRSINMDWYYSKHPELW